MDKRLIYKAEELALKHKKIVRAINDLYEVKNIIAKDNNDITIIIEYIDRKKRCYANPELISTKEFSITPHLEMFNSLFIVLNEQLSALLKEIEEL